MSDDKEPKPRSSENNTGGSKQEKGNYRKSPPIHGWIGESKSDQGKLRKGAEIPPKTKPKDSK